jgi:hypothetical protein
MRLTEKIRKVALKRLFFLLIALWIIFAFLSADEDGPLEIRASINPKRLSKGQEGKVVLKLFLKEGIKISSQPSFLIELEQCNELIFPKNFFTASDLEMEIQEEAGEEYLKLEKPIEIPFTVTLEAERGNHLLEGKIKYFACSKEEEWCLKSSTDFSASFYTRKTVAKKRK